MSISRELPALEDIIHLKLDEFPDVTLRRQFKRILRQLLLTSGTHFDRYFFKVREGSKWIENQHHTLIDKIVQRVIDGEISRLIVNIPPGYTKTEKVVINFICRSMAINSDVKFIHASYADDLALLNSQTIRDVVCSDEYQELFPMLVREDVSAKKRWFTEKGGGMLAVAAGGAITGFRAGRMVKDRFTGSFVIDDPLKPDDAYSAAKRNQVNNRFNNTMRSRLAVESIPIVVIMQRIHEGDLTAFLLKGGSGDYWHHLCLPALIPEIRPKYPKEFTHGIEVDYDLPVGPLWKFKHTEKQLLTMKTADPYTYSSQYDQRPSPLGGGLFKDKWWKFYAINTEANPGTPTLPKDISFIVIYGDTAQKTAEHNDYSVFQAWGYSPTMGAILLDQIRGKWEAPQLKSMMKAFWAKWSKPTRENGYVSAMEVKIEDKSSGSSLIQDIKNDTFIPISGIQKNKDKVFEAMGAIPQIAAGNVWIPIDASYINDFLHEHNQFTPMMTHDNDDQVDVTVMAVKDLLVNGSNFYSQF